MIHACAHAMYMLTVIPGTHCNTSILVLTNAPINVMPHYPPPGHHRGQGGDLTN